MKARTTITDLIADVLIDDNPRFDRGRFEEWIYRVRHGEDLKGLR